MYLQVLVIAYTPEQLNQSSWQIPKGCQMTLVWTEDQARQVLGMKTFDQVVRLTD